MTQRDPVVALRQMLDFAKTLVAETEGQTNQEILDSAVLWNASIHLIQNVGEAASRVDQDLRDRAVDIPWRGMIGVRNVIAHGYDSLTPRVIFDIIRVDIPQLVEQLEMLIRELEGEIGS